jgi:hypothetical protein
MFQKCKLLTWSHGIYIIFYCFEVRNLDFRDLCLNLDRIFDGFYLDFHFLGCTIPTYHKSFIFSIRSSTNFHPPLNSHVSHLAVKRTISLKSCQSPANLSFWTPHFHSNSSAKKHNLRNKKPLLRNP